MTMGIYSITCTPTGEQYIGQSMDIKRRWRIHRTTLRTGIHHTPKLQDLWDKYTAQDFTFTILEAIDDENDLKMRESYYIGLCDLDKLLNAVTDKDLQDTNRQAFRVRELAEQQGLDAAKLARRADLSYAAVLNMWKGSTQNPAYVTLLKISTVLGVTISDLIITK